MGFRSLGLNEKTLFALSRINYTKPTEVQQKAIPEIIAGNNLLVRSQTGTGKTAAFGIGIIERLAGRKSKKALILTPTRELAVQVCKELQNIGQTQHLMIHAVYGGQGIEGQIDNLRRGFDVVIATPGRLLDLSRRGVIRINEFDIIVLDEADQMLDMGFLDEVTEILDQLPQQRVGMLFSATLDDSIMRIAAKYVKQPKIIEIGEIKAAETIKEEHVEITDIDKFPKLIGILRSHVGVKTLIFRETKIGASKLQEKLWQRGFKVGALQGDMSQAKRNKTIQEFKEGMISILVATNVAARGLHIENLGLIINYDKAQSEEVHLHRIGRTGRMGQEGKAINFIQRKQTLDERMSEDHPDFAWMKQGSGVYSRSSRTEQERRPHHSRSTRHESKDYHHRNRRPARKY